MALEDPIYTSAVLNTAQEPPRDSSIDSFNSNNLISAGKEGLIQNSRRCTILNGNRSYIYDSYNVHCIGLDSLFYIGYWYQDGATQYRVILREYYEDFIIKDGDSFSIKIKTRFGWTDLSLRYLNFKYVYYNEDLDTYVFSSQEYAMKIISRFNYYLSNSFYINCKNGLSVFASSPTRSIQVKNSNVIESCADIISNNLSDIRLKKNSSNIKNSLSLLSKINAVSFSWNERQGVLKGDDIGLIAQEVERCFPLASNTRSDGVKSIDYRKMIPILVSCVKEKQKKIDNLKSKIKEIKDYI